MRVALVEPQIMAGAHTIYAGNNALEPLGLEYLAGVALRRGWEPLVLSERVMGGRLMDELARWTPDVVAVTSLTCNANCAREIARTAKVELGCTTIAGGYHASAMPEYFANEVGVDYVVVGEGELAFDRILAEIESGVSKERGRIVSAPRRLGFSELPWPMRSEQILWNSRLLGLMVPSPSRQNRVAAISASRGCPNSCQFCATSSVWGQRQLRVRAADDFAAEMLSLADDYGVDAVFLSDLTLNSSKARVRELCGALLRNGVKASWYGMCHLGNLDDELVGLMSEAGCVKIGLGIEHPYQSMRDMLKDGYHASDEELYGMLDLAHRHGILVKGYFMTGYPWETAETLMRFREGVLGLPFDEIKVSFYTPFPGTEAYETLINSLVSQDWAVFDTVTCPVLKMAGVSSDDILGWRRDLFRDFYSSNDYRTRCRANCNRNAHWRAAYADLQSQLRQASVEADIIME